MAAAAKGNSTCTIAYLPLSGPLQVPKLSRAQSRNNCRFGSPVWFPGGSPAGNFSTVVTDARMNVSAMQTQMNPLTMKSK
jgi:hypothetical protein